MNVDECRLALEFPKSKDTQFHASPLPPPWDPLRMGLPARLPMPFSIRPYRRFPMQCSVTPTAGPGAVGVARDTETERVLRPPPFRGQAARTEEESP